MAVHLSDLAMTRVLLLAGADVRMSTHKGRTPLHIAANNGAEELVRCLLLAGSDPAAQDANGHSCLDMCDPDASNVLELLQK